MVVIKIPKKPIRHGLCEPEIAKLKIRMNTLKGSETEILINTKFIEPKEIMDPKAHESKLS